MMKWIGMMSLDDKNCHLRKKSFWAVLLGEEGDSNSNNSHHYLKANNRVKGGEGIQA
jgi:hypothetical protein